MDFVAGGSLSKLCRDKPVPAIRAAELVRQLAETVHYAHGEGVLHRNLNPARVLLTTTGVPRITGFAFPERMQAWTNSETLSRTQGGEISELVGHQSPEQALGEPRLMGPATDVYALGAVLYSLLTCRAPFMGDSPAQTIIQLLKEDPVSPRTLNPGVPRDLELICLKCLQKQRHARYVTAQMLAEDLSRFLEGRPIIPQPIGLLSRIVKWARRQGISITHRQK
jgi:serine/threonine protein kinase